MYLSFSNINEAHARRTFTLTNKRLVATRHMHKKDLKVKTPPTPSPTTRLPPLRPSRLPSTVLALRYLCASEKRASRAISVLRLTRPHAQGVPRPRRAGRLCRCARRWRRRRRARSVRTTRARSAAAAAATPATCYSPYAGSHGVPRVSAPQRWGLDEDAADDADELEAAEPPAADRGSCPHSDHPRGITSEGIDSPGARTQKNLCASGTPWGPTSRRHSRRPRRR